MAQPRTVSFLARLCLVCLFPFSALDKVINRKEALQQAASGVLPDPPLLLDAAIVVEALAPVCILTGRGDRAAAGVLAGFCAVTALLYHPFWKSTDFWAEGKSEGREHFWEFLKNFGLVGGLLLVVFGRELDSPLSVLRHPISTPQRRLGR